MASPSSKRWIRDVTSSNEEENDNWKQAGELDPNLWCQLADDVLQKIWARLPLKALVRSRVLCRKWNRVFQSPTFQAEVNRVSSQWASYFPLFYDDGGFRGYDRTCNNWQQLFPFPKSSRSIPEGFDRDCKWWECFCTLTGNVIAFCLYSSNNVLHISVTNLMSSSESTRELPPLDLTGDGPLDLLFDESRSKWIMRKNLSCDPFCPLAGLAGNCCSVLLLPNHDSSCKVLVFTRNLELNVLQVRVFDPDVNSWTECRRGPEVPRKFPRLDSCVYLKSVCYLCFLEPLDDGFFFTFHRYLEESMFLYAYNADEDLFRQIVLPPQEEKLGHLIQDCQMVVCGGELLLVACSARLRMGEVAHEPPGTEFAFGNLRRRHFYMNRCVDRTIYQGLIYVFRLDLETLQVTEVSSGPPEPLDSWINSGLVVADKDSIYIPAFPTVNDYYNNEIGDKCILIFNLRERAWTSLTLEHCPWMAEQSTPCILQPGVHPFCNL